MLILLLILFFWRWRKQRRQHYETQISREYRSAEKLYTNDPRDQQAGGVEISGKQPEGVHEISGEQAKGVHEISGQPLAELPLSGPGLAREP